MSIKLTSNAKEKILELIALEERYVPKFRVFVTGGGCSGMEYGFSFEKEAQGDDWVLTHMIDGKDASIDVLIDPISFSYVAGSTVDYKAGLKGEGFSVQNPNAVATCSCGSSFAIE